MFPKVVVRAVMGTLLLFSFARAADDYVDMVRKGNKAYFENNFDKALEQYRNAEIELPESAELNYNIAGSLFKQGKYEEAVELYTKALNSTEIDLEAASHYNLGNTYFRMEDYQNAIKSYENTLNINPNDLDAKYNLELSRKRLKEQIKPKQQDKQQQQQQQQEQEKKEQEQKDQQDQKQNEEEQNQQQQQQEQGGGDDKQKEKEKQQQQKQEQAKKMTKEDAKRILNALKDEQDVQKKIRRQTARGNYSGKDW